MSRMSDLFISIQDDIEQGILSFQQIARKYDVPMSWVNDAWDALCEQYEEEESHRRSYEELDLA